MSEFVYDIETTGLLNETTIDYLSSPYVLKDDFKIHCAVFQNKQTREIIAFYNGPTYEFDGREYNEGDGKYVLKDYEPIQYTHYQMSSLLPWIVLNVKKVTGHNIINYDLLACKLYFGWDYTVGPDSWCGEEIEINDTLVISKTQNPDRYGGHDLETWGQRVGKDKIAFRKHIPADERFKDFGADMLYYCIRDAVVNLLVDGALKAEAGAWNWKPAIELEKKVMYIVTHQAHRGFKFDTDLAKSNVEELDGLMEERRQKIEPLLPPKPATKAVMGEYTPPKVQFKKNLELSANMLKWAEKRGWKLEEVDDNWFLDTGEKKLQLPLPQEPLVTSVKASIDDTTHIKGWLVSLGWEPTEWAERDISVKTDKSKKNKEELQEAIDKYVEQCQTSVFGPLRMEALEVRNTFELRKKLEKAAEKGKPMKLPSNPKFTVGQEKEVCPKLKKMSEKFPYATDIVEYLTYRHRRNSILGGGIDWEDYDEEEDYTGFLPNVRSDGRIATPADTCGAACVVADTRLITDNGYRKIVDVAVGDLVLTHKGQYQRVTDKIVNGIKPVFEVTLSDGRRVTCTDNHPFLVEGNWKQCKDLQSGDIVSVYGNKEEWKQAPGYSKYFISNTGIIMSIYGKEIETVRRTSLWDRANVDVQYDDGNIVRKGVGGLVLLAFIGSPPKGTEVCHKDGNPMNNNLTNLYYGTSKENKADAKLHGQSLKASYDNAKLTREQVKEIKTFFKEIGYVRGDDTRLAKYYECSRETIGQIRRGERWTREEVGNLYFEEFDNTSVESIKCVGNAPTFDITVGKDHSYLANGIVCHNTSRMKHKVVANIPRVTSLYGENMRAIFGVDKEKYYQLGYDFASLEARVESHYCWKYDPDKEYCNSLIQEKPNDVHTRTAKAISEILQRDFSRTNAKSTKYACSYGAQAAKVAKTIGADIQVGQLVFDAFWQAAAPLASLKDALTKYWETTGEKKFVLGLDGRKIPTRSKHALVNSLFQSAGVICAKMVMVLHYDKLREAGLIVDFFSNDWRSKTYCQQLIAYHDECQTETSKSLVKFKMFKEEAEAKAYKETLPTSSAIGHSAKGYFVATSPVADLLQEAVDETTQHFKLKVPLAIEWMAGTNWANTH